MKIKGLDRLKRKARNLQQLDELRGEVRAGAIHVMGKIKQYPPATEANMPRTKVVRSPGGTTLSTRTLPWYERGYGVRYPGGGGRPVSEQLGLRWTVRSLAGGLAAVISNNASYAVFVHSEEKQARFHGRRGWMTDKDVLEQEKDTIRKKLQVGVRRELAK